MSYQSLFYGTLFLPAVFVLYTLTKQAYRKYVLLGASWLFYFLAMHRVTWVLVATCVGVYGAALWIDRASGRQRTFRLTCAIALLALSLGIDASGAIADRIARVRIEGNQKLTFGPTTDTPHANAFTLTVWDADGKPVSETALKSEGFSVDWDAAGFQTENDLPGQYCDSYGAFSVNGKASLATSFDLRNVPMNFYGTLRAVLKVGDKTFRAEMPVVALGNERIPNTQTLPEGGYPKDFNGYPDQLLGAKVLAERYGIEENSLILWKK